MKKFLVIAATIALGLSFSFAEGEGAKGKGKTPVDPAKKAEALIKQLDKDGNGTLSKEEYATAPWAAKAKEKGGEGAIDKIFASRDKNKDGQLDKDELAAPRQHAPGKGGKGGKGGKSKAAN